MNHLSQEEKYMQRCLQLAQMAEGNTYPNPMVGSVIVHKGKIIGEGYHQKAGEPHAEVNAVHSVKDQSLLRQSTLYVNLEPCAHYGKTPPCSKLIIDKAIPHVVIGCIDSYSEVAGKGIEMMKKAGVDVKTGVLEAKSLELNRRFFTFHNKQRPYIILKWAETQDGFVDIKRTDADYGQPTWITNEWARRAVHKQRTTEEAVLVGTQTALKDNPSLTVRDWSGKQPLRCVIDKECQLDGQYHLLDNTHQTVIYNLRKEDRVKLTEYVKLDAGKDLTLQILKDLWQRNIQSLIVEGGSATLQCFINADLWDEAHRYVGDVFFKKGVKAPEFSAKIKQKHTFGDSQLFVYRNNL
ncbi:bifunctional diaminohydroxyphosphoribosylaminopyrimidine deaminase/5-amino-6-(5-phosphoribosylamino)uracil reductase RibD [Carboxylicivirga mesophila]|uniref:Riboflavin biosynthesis protein RibD n=1 Tax=Carboxylicivirga mesophila TaxID=1166478 RepID=A0ABS5K6I8_9BACT|nr:bifunctional diaminohydroxyphosphoribosylaminopyrimidine deaminase/5-amino-6-(5-phosphoribosylamino)uracil reductase RibD [Carboxylicivirga mesophila]MBS2210580.1 bifunctional diaminohydroxyphosphoribosylaminopyrimidine deaminase/5-amino-6-(5-phosphoribosylamino)uracil reductase RibD [Carboxylicivirga mesophila]